MNYVIMLSVAIVTLLWYIRPLYNFMAKRKYVLLDVQSMSIARRIQSGLPAVTFYILILGFMFYPAIANDLIETNQTGSIVLIQIVFIFFLTRYDKRQTKYKVTDKGLKFKRRFINWEQPYSIKYKRNFLVILHKPRFILKSRNTTIVVPMLSHNIKTFITEINQKNDELGHLLTDLYENTRDYYIANLKLEKEINKIGK